MRYSIFIDRTEIKLDLPSDVLAIKHAFKTNAKLPNYVTRVFKYIYTAPSKNDADIFSFRIYYFDSKIKVHKITSIPFTGNVKDCLKKALRHKFAQQFPNLEVYTLRKYKKREVLDQWVLSINLK